MMVFIAGSLGLRSGDEVGLRPLDLTSALTVAYPDAGTTKFFRLARKLLVRKQNHGECGEPVFTCVVATGDVSERGGGVFLGGDGKDLARRVTLRQSVRDASHAPRATEIQTIKMNELRVRTVGNDRGL